MEPIINIATTCARSAGNIILRYHNKIETLNITNKAANDFVSEVDKKAEDIIITTIKKHFPKHSILGEESGEIIGDNDYKWVIDPLDGTTNYLHGLPHYAVSIALFVKGKVKHGVIYDPFKDELFYASQGNGAFLNNKRIRVSVTNGLENTLIGTGFPFKQPQHLACYLKTFKAIHPHVAGIRRAGSAALDLAYLAAARFDGFWEIGLQTWDIAAGALLVKEAGGFIGDFSGNDNYFNTGNVVAGNKIVFKEILKIIQPHLNKDLRS